MAEPFWKNLVEALKAREFESPYLDRLQEQLRVSRATMTLEDEILQEMRFGLNQSEDKANFALLELQVLAEAVSSAENDLGYARRVKDFNAGVTRARRAIWEHRVHCEALGLPWSTDVERLFPLPEYKSLTRSE